MSYRKPLLAFVALAALSGGVAFATDTLPAGAPKPPQAKLAALDKNGDGFVDRGEATADPKLAAKFDELDKDKDGKLSADELRRGFGQRGHDWRDGGPFARLDTDKDGRISREEAKADPRFAERFDQLDVDKDGFIDKADFRARATQRRDAWFASADTDKDGKLSKAEFDAAVAQHKGFWGGPGHGPHDAKRPLPDKPAVPPQS
ncbi:MAG: EF-hand domain-containing protein [Pseudomonas sp.]